MSVSSLQTHDAYVWGLVEQLCNRIRGAFPEATFAICPIRPSGGPLLMPMCQQTTILQCSIW